MVTSFLRLYLVYQLVCSPNRFYIRCGGMITTFYRMEKGLYFIEIALRVYLIIRKYRGEIVSLTEDFFCFMMGMQFLHGDAEDGGGRRRKGKFLYLREMIGARMSADFQ